MKNKAATWVGVIILIVIVLIVGYNYLGWFGGYNSWKIKNKADIQSNLGVPSNRQSFSSVTQKPQPSSERISNILSAPDNMKVPNSTGKCDCFKHMGFVYLPDPAHTPDTYCYYKKTSFTDCPPKGPSHGPR